MNKSNAELVYNWLKIAGANIQESPIDNISIETQKLSLNIITEELFELAESMSTESLKYFVNMIREKCDEVENTILPIHNNTKANLTKYEDACTDIEVTLNNARAFAGISHNAQENFNTVMQENYAKFCDSEEEAVITVDKYKNGTHDSYKDKEDCYYVESYDKFVVKRKKDNKIMKSYLFHKRINK